MMCLHVIPPLHGWQLLCMPPNCFSVLHESTCAIQFMPCSHIMHDMQQAPSCTVGWSLLQLHTHGLLHMQPIWQSVGNRQLNTYGTETAAPHTPCMPPPPNTHQIHHPNDLALAMSHWSNHGTILAGGDATSPWVASCSLWVVSRMSSHKLHHFCS